MTAKEMAENALMLAQDGHPIFWFEPDEFRVFVDQLCREQREAASEWDQDCYRVTIEDVAGDIYVKASDIRNAKQPEV